MTVKCFGSRECSPGHRDYLPPNPNEDEACCPALGIGEARGYACTREKDHEGDHAAHGSCDHMYARWPR
jgi:hypothetical protein